MSDYIYTSDGELYHYGVVGMKWGVRRGRTARSYEKASKKLSKLTNKADKAQVKADKKLAVAQRAAYGWSRKSAQKTKWKAGRQQYKADKRKKKALKWINQMEKTFKNTTVKLSKNQVDVGKRYMEQLKKRSDASSLSFL